MRTDVHMPPDEAILPSASGDGGAVRPSPACPSAGGRIGRRGLIAAAVGAIPMLGPWLLNSLLAAACCGGLGAGATATAATASAGAAGTQAIGFGAWWLMPASLAIVLAGQVLRGRHRHGSWARIAAAAGTTALLSVGVYFATMLIVAQLQHHLIG